MGYVDDDSFRRRLMRWLPIPVLLLAVLGLAMQMIGSDGLFISGAAFLVAILMTYFNPLLDDADLEPFDTREELWRLRATLAGAGAALTLATFGTLVFASSERWGFWKPMTQEDWMAIFSTLPTVYCTVRILHANWSTQPLGEQGE